MSQPIRRSAAAFAAAWLFAVHLFAGATAAAPAMVLRYDRPAQDNDAGWEREALPIGNGRIGAMVFGQPAREHLQFNEISLWTGDERTMGAYQPFGDLLVELAGHASGASDYRRSLDLARGIHTVSYVRDGVTFRREAWASFPAQVIVLRLSADRPGQLSGSVALSDRHGARIAAAGKSLVATGTLAGYVPPGVDAAGYTSTNAMTYASQVQVVNEGGRITVQDGGLVFSGCDALTLVLGAGTSYVIDAARRFKGDDPLPRVRRQVAQAAARPW